jgi:signal transduction histidine kinase
MRAPDRFRRFLGSWRADAVLAAGLGAGTAGYIAALGLWHGWKNAFTACCILAVIGCIVPRRAYPRLAAVAAGCLMALAPLGNLAPMPSSPPFVAVFLLAYSLGTADEAVRSLLALACLGLGSQIADGISVFNPFIVVGTAGPFALGLVMRSRRRLTDQLAARGLELEAERALFAAEAVRYERARIARELHDIVAHCISVMVIQASAGQRLAGREPALAAEAFDAIAEAIRQAEAEIGRLVELLSQPGSHGIDGIGLVNELVARSSAAGLAVSCRVSGPADGITEQASEAMYRVVQEGLTNALKHAPGAPVEVVIADADGELVVSIANGPPAGAPTGLEQTGGGRGLAGMRERVRACGGELTAGPADGGGWRVLARLPGGAQVSPRT